MYIEFKISENEQWARNRRANARTNTGHAIFSPVSSQLTHPTPWKNNTQLIGTIGVITVLNYCTLARRAEGSMRRIRPNQVRFHL